MLKPGHRRNRFPKAFLPGHAYLHNTFFNISTEQITDTELHAMSLGEIARMIRLSVMGCATQEKLLSQMKWKYEHAGQTQIPFSPGDRMHCEFLGSFNLFTPAKTLCSHEVSSSCECSFLRGAVCSGQLAPPHRALLLPRRSQHCKARQARNWHWRGAGHDLQCQRCRAQRFSHQIQRCRGRSRMRHGLGSKAMDIGRNGKVCFREPVLNLFLWFYRCYQGCPNTESQ